MVFYAPAISSAATAPRRINERHENMYYYNEAAAAAAVDNWPEINKLGEGYSTYISLTGHYAFLFKSSRYYYCYYLFPSGRWFLAPAGIQYYYVPAAQHTSAALV